MNSQANSIRFLPRYFYSVKKTVDESLKNCHRLGAVFLPLNSGDQHFFAFHNVNTLSGREFMRSRNMGAMFQFTTKIW